MLKVVDHYFIFNGKSSLDFSAIIDGNQTFKGAERDVERFAVPGRNGDLTIDNGRFNSYIQPYAGFIVKDFENNAEAFRNWLTQDGSFHRLEDTIHPDEYRMASYAGPFDPTVIFLEAGSFTIDFYCQPERWLKSGEKAVTITAGTTVKLWNPTLFIAKPLIHVTRGTGRINVGSEIINLGVNNGNTYIDCQIEDAWEGTTNRNGNVTRITGAMPFLTPGENRISVGTGMTIELTPRWWKI